MEPILPTPERREGLPEQDIEQVPVPIIPVNPENAPNIQAERPHERVVVPKSTPATDDIQSVTPSDNVIPKLPVSPVPTTNTGAGPAIADDVDVMEKEWVDRAKKIVSETKDKPHQQEKAVSRLQADYLLKRYGKQIKLKE